MFFSSSGNKSHSDNRKTVGLHCLRLISQTRLEFHSYSYLNVEWLFKAMVLKI